jgi:hypothetical protein
MALDHPSRAHLHQQLANNSRPPSTSPSMQGAHQQDPRMSQISSPGGHPAPRQQRPYNITERIGGQAARDNSLLGGPPSPEPDTTYNAQTLPNQQGLPNGRIEPNGVHTYPNNIPTNNYNDMGQRIEPGPPNNAPYGTSQPTMTNQPIQNTVNKFAVVNGSNRDELDSPRSSRIHEPYLTAADEKRALAQKMTDPNAYASIPPPGAPPPAREMAPMGGSPTSSTHMQAATSSRPQEKPAQKWMSAEDEKKKLYEDAKAAAELTQRRAVNSSQNASAAAATTAVKSPSPQSKQVSCEYLKQDEALNFLKFTETQVTPPGPVMSPTYVTH